MKTFLKNIFFISFIFISLYLSLELGYHYFKYYSYWKARKNWHHPVFTFIDPYDRQTFVLKENSLWKDKSRTYKINNKGLRGKEYSYKKPPNTYRILILGDSYAFGWGVGNSNDTYANRVEYLLNKNNKKHPIEIINAGIPGYNTIQELAYFEKEGLKYNPDLVIVSFYINDAEPSGLLELYPPLLFPDSHLWLWETIKFRLNLLFHTHFFKTKRHYAKQEYLLSGFLKNQDYFKWEEAANALEDIFSIAHHQNKDIALIIFPDVSHDFHHYPYTIIHKTVMELAQKENIGALDLLPFSYNKNNAELHVPFSDDPSGHPNEKGHEFFTNIIADFLRKKLAP